MVSYLLAFLAGLVNATGNVLNRKAAGKNRTRPSSS